MSKKLVKTAKQQFEERLREFGLWDTWSEHRYEGTIGTRKEDGGIVIFSTYWEQGGFH